MKIQNFILPPPIFWGTLLILFGTQLAFAKTEASCSCSDPDFNVVIDPAVYPTGATLSDLQGDYPFLSGNSMTNTCLSIQGHLKINRNFTINGGEVIMGPGAKITVMTTRSFTLSGVNANGGMHGCTNMWAGIYRENSLAGAISVLNSTVQDAEYGIYSRHYNGSPILVDGSEFLNNYVGIYTGAFSGLPFPEISINPLNVAASTFSGKNYLSPSPSSGFSGATGIGILAEQSRDLQVGALNKPENIFDGLNTGVRCMRLSNEGTLQNNLFKNMGTLYSGSPGSGRGIWASDSDILVEGSTFDACQVGVYAIRSSTTVQKENNFSDCSFGIFVADPVDKTVLIKDNVSVDVERSIFVWGLGPAKSISISDNEIAAKPLPTSTGITGIQVSGYPTFMTATDGITIETNIVNLLSSPPTFRRGGYGIGVTKVNGAVVSENTVTTAFRYSNFIIFSSANTVIRENEALSTSVGNAISIADSPNNKIICNLLQATLSFSGNCDCTLPDGLGDCTEISGNEFERDNRPTLVVNNAITSPQKWQGNQWLVVDLVTQAMYAGDILRVADSKFTVHTLGLPYHPQSVSVRDGDILTGTPEDPELWFKEEASGNYFICGTTEEFAPVDTSVIKRIYKAYAEGAFGTAGYGAGAQWMAERHLYRSLKESPNQMGDPVLQQFHSTASIHAAFDAVDEGLSTLFSVPSAVKEELEDLKDTQHTQGLAFQVLYETPDPEDESELALLEAQRASAAADLDQTSAAIDSIEQTLQLGRDSLLNSISTANAAISVSGNTPATYLKAVYTAYLTKLATGMEWNASTQSALEAIAALCPSEGGDAVYMANAALHSLEAEDCWAIEAVLSPPPPAMLAAENSSMEQAGIFPNPGRSEFFVRTPVSASEQANLRLYNLTGQLLLQAAVPTGSQVPLDLSALPGGLYLYEVWDGQERLMKGKLSKMN